MPRRESKTDSLQLTLILYNNDCFMNDITNAILKMIKTFNDKLSATKVNYLYCLKLFRRFLSSILNMHYK